LALILDQSFTKYQCCGIREDARTRNADFYPHYKMVAEKKKHCQTANITITVAKAALQDLLNHTTARIVDYQEETVVTSMKNQQTTLSSSELILSYEFDGSTGQLPTLYRRFITVCFDCYSSSPNRFDCRKT